MVQLVSYVVIGISWVDRFFDEFVVNLGFDEGCKGVSAGGKDFVAVAERACAKLFARDWTRAGRTGAADDLGVSPVMSSLPLITILTFVPFFGAIVLMATCGDNKAMARRVALGVGFVSLALALVMWKAFDVAATGFQLEDAA